MSVARKMDKLWYILIIQRIKLLACTQTGMKLLDYINKGSQTPPHVCSV